MHLVIYLYSKISNKINEKKVKENLEKKGCHSVILSLHFICGSIAGLPAIRGGCKL
ncbi:MAG: hypothetical protein K0R21_663 [Anaerocolumna sp.]|jgi:hypothetical protein|nr:hypothetical protein [Anaerocolumna sp.]